MAGGKVWVVGIGPGDLDHMSGRAQQVLREVDVVVGYSTYLELVDEFLAGKTVVKSGMGGEVQRCTQAVEHAAQGKKVAVVSSGDPGVYGMASLVWELASQREPAVEVEVVPGITAAMAAAASLGAPISHDFAVVSLSDWLIPWAEIEARVRAAAQTDFVTVVYNPWSSQRTEQIGQLQQIFLQYRHPRTPVGIVRNAKRGQETVILAELADFTDHPIDMLCTVIIGNSQTYVRGGKMITPRGYATKSSSQ